MPLSSKHKEAQQRLNRMRKDHERDYNKHKDYMDSREEGKQDLQKNELTQIHQYVKTVADESKDKDERTEFLNKKGRHLEKIRNPAEDFDRMADHLYHTAPISVKGGAINGSYLHEFGINSDDPDKYTDENKKVNMKISKDVDSWETAKRHGLAKRRIKTHGYSDVKGTNARFQYSYDRKEDKDVTDELDDKTASGYLDEEKFKNLYTNDRDHRSDVVHGIDNNEEKKKFIDNTMNNLTDTESKRDFLRQQTDEIEKKTVDDDSNNHGRKFTISSENIGKSDKEIEKKHQMTLISKEDKIDTDKKVRDDLDKKTREYFKHEADLNHKALQESNQSVKDHIEKHRNLLKRNEEIEDPQRKIEKKRLVNSLYKDHDEKKFDEHFAEKLKANAEHKQVGFGRNRLVYGGRKNFDATYEGEDKDGKPVTERYVTHENTHKDILEEHPDDEDKMDDHLVTRKGHLLDITAHTASYDKNMDEMKKELSKSDSAIQRKVISDRYKETLEEHKKNLHNSVKDYSKSSFINKNRNNDHYSARPLEERYGTTNEDDVDHQSEKAKKIAHLTDEEHSKFFQDGKYTDPYKRTQYKATQHVQHVDLSDFDEDDDLHDGYKLDEKNNYVKNYHATVLNTHRELGHTENDLRHENDKPYEKIKQDAKDSYNRKYKENYGNDKGDFFANIRKKNEKQMEENEQIFQKGHKIHDTKFVPEAEKSVGEYAFEDKKKRVDNYRDEAEKPIDKLSGSSNVSRDSTLDVDDGRNSMSSMSSRRSSTSSIGSSMSSRRSSTSSIGSSMSTDEEDYKDEDKGEGEDGDTVDQSKRGGSNKVRRHDLGGTTGYGDNNGNFTSTTSDQEDDDGNRDNRTRTKQTYESASQESTITTEGKHVPMGENAAPTLHDENGKITHKFKDGSSLEFQGTVENGKPTTGILQAKDGDGKPTKKSAYDRLSNDEVKSNEENVVNNAELRTGETKDKELRKKHDSNPSNYTVHGKKKEYKPSNDQLKEGTSKSSLKNLDPDTSGTVPVTIPKDLSETGEESGSESFTQFEKDMSSGSMTDAEKSFESTFPSENQITTAQDTVTNSINAANDLTDDVSHFAKDESELTEGSLGYI
jgi:hypothetical protein